MGLFNRPTVAQPSNSHSFTDVIQNEGDNISRGLIAWRHPSSDFNTHSKLIVRVGEEAIFENGAQFSDPFPQGEYDLATSNYPFIRSLIEMFSGGQSRFPSRVYFISTEEFEIEWGTLEAIGYSCPIIGPGAQLHGGGEYVIRIVNSGLFAAKVLRDAQSYSRDDLKAKLLSRVYKNVAAIISEVLEANQINCMEVSKKALTVADLCKAGIGKLLEPYGIALVDFTIELAVDEDQRQMYEQAVRQQRMSATGEAQARVIGAQGKVAELNTLGENYQRIKGMELLETLASNPGSGGDAAAMGAGLGMGVAAGGAFAGLAQSVFSSFTPQQPPQQPQNVNSYGGASRFGSVTQPQAPAQEDDVKKLTDLKAMLDAGLISQQEYDDTKNAILLKMRS